MSREPPTVYLEDGTPVKPRIVGADFIGVVGGEGHLGYEGREDAEHTTLYFEDAND